MTTYAMLQEMLALLILELGLMSGNSEAPGRRSVFFRPFCSSHAHGFKQQRSDLMRSVEKSKTTPMVDRMPGPVRLYDAIFTISCMKSQSSVFLQAKFSAKPSNLR